MITLILVYGRLDADLKTIKSIKITKLEKFLNY